MTKRLTKLRLKVYATEDSNAMVQNIELMYSNPPTKRFIGWRLKPVEVDGKERFAYERTNKCEDVAYHPDYVKAVQKGDLLAADSETAKLCKVSISKESFLKDK